MRPVDLYSVYIGIWDQAILVERERALQEKARALRAPDPVSSSRSPNAKVEPPYKTRYTTHNFASPSREIQRNSVSPHRLGYSLELVNLGNRVWPASVQSQCRPNHQTASHNVSALRPGYIAGQLSVASTNSSTILGSHLSSFRDASHSNDYKNEAIQGEDSRPRVNGCDSIQSYLSPTCVNGLCVNGDALYSNRDFGSSLLASSPSVICSPAPYDLATKQDAPSKASKSRNEIAYKDLVTSLGRQPRGIDRTRLEVSTAARDGKYE
ncbi:unnamed protein product [Mesocestoides corti]|uniref:Uncharacterized protein n=1 Tax=Mesocestoides corti TaxID=53468 RepID=A0A0R3UAR5_MESCO|nr:unnamed protein product [Mesocestoides corti]